METDAAAPKDDKMETEEKKDEGDAKGVTYLLAFYVFL